MEWLSANMGTIVVSLILIAIVIWDIRKIINDRKKGIKSCGMNCPGRFLRGSEQKRKNR